MYLIICMGNFDEEHEIPSSKRAKMMVQEASAVSTHNSLSPMNENSPLGLKLRKSPSLLDLVQLSLLCPKNQEAGVVENQEGLAHVHTVRSIPEAGEVENQKCMVFHTSALDKKKPTNFSASILRIGSWECFSKHEGDLVVKCYFSKRKLAWEVLEGGLKSKIEIQWSAIIGLKATFPENKPATLVMQLSRPPVFFKESNPQPRRSTIWKVTSDFTRGQATIYRRHFLQFPEGVLDKNYESLIQSDVRLNILSNKDLANTDSPFFDSRCAPFNHHWISYRPGEDNLSHLLPQSQSQSVYLNSDYYLSPLSSLPETNKIAMVAPLSLMIPNYDQSHLDDRERIFAADISDCISQEGTSRSSNKRILNEIAHYLLGDNLPPDYEHSNVDRITSTMCSLHQEDIQ